MKRTRIMGLAAALLLAALCAFADGGGGTFYGVQASRYPLLEQYPVVNNSLGLTYFGGYGYGVADHTISGGFGGVIHDAGDEEGIRGAFGGVINGVRIFRLPISLSIISWTGLGCISTGAYQTADGSQFFYLSEELNLELGIPITRWFMPTVFAGYQVAGNLYPGGPFQSFLTYTPVIGVRLAWGKFF